VRVKASPAGPKTEECSRKLNLQGAFETDINKAPRSFRCTDERDGPEGGVRDVKLLSANYCLLLVRTFVIALEDQQARVRPLRSRDTHRGLQIDQLTCFYNTLVNEY
jgi:hypothetical protein